MSTLTTSQKSIVDALDANLDSSLDVGLNNPDASVNFAPLPNYSLNKTGFRGIFRAAAAALVGLLEDWTAAALINSYTSTGTPWSTPSYYKDPWGRVHLRGHVGGGTANVTIFQCPYAPSEALSFVVMNNGSPIELRINNIGQVFTVGAVSVTNLSLDGVSFRTA